MKKILLTAACLFIASPASAATLSYVNMAFYDASNTFTSYETTATGTLDTSVASGHIVGDIPFFGAVWSADEVWVSSTPGNNVWAGSVHITYSAMPTNFNYTFSLALGDIALGLYFDWGGNYDIPVLAVFRHTGWWDWEEIWEPVDQIWYKGISTTPKMGMQTSPFPGQMPKFTAYIDRSVTVPEPASMLLLGTGLAGLIGAAYRQRR